VIELAEAMRQVDRIAGPLLSDHFMWGAMRHSLIDNVLCGMRLETERDVIDWLGKTGARGLGVARR
jgi:hypothetical protein